LLKSFTIYKKQAEKFEEFVLALGLPIKLVISNDEALELSIESPKGTLKL